MKPIDIHRRKGGVAGPIITIPSDSYENYVVDPANATCTIDFRTDGTCAVSAGTTPSSPTNWRGPGGAGSDYDISFNGGGSWANLGTNQTKTVSRSIIGTSSGTFDTRIRRVSDGVTVATGSITLTAIVDS